MEEKSKELAVVKPREVAKRARPAGTVAVNPQSLLLAAVKGKTSPEGIRAIMEMRRELVEEQAKREYYDALGEFQRELEPIIKTKVVKNRQDKIDAGEADEVRFRYAPIEKIAKAIQQGCDRHGFSYSFDSEDFKDAKVRVCCIIHHVGGYETRHWFPSPVLFEAGAKIGQNPSQVMNGAITFGRRVSLVMGFGIMTADPDPEGNPLPVAVEPKSTTETQAEKKKPAGTSDGIDSVFEEVTKLIESKCSGKAAANFIATAHKHYDANRKDLLVALRTSLKGMKQGAR